MDGQNIPLADDLDGLGLGVYSPTEAARLIDTPVSTLKSWLRDNGARKSLWEPQHPRKDKELLLGFRDLVQAKVVRALRQRGYSAQKIREAILNARDIIGDNRPFSTTQFKTDGRDILLDFNDGLTTVSGHHKGQTVFRAVVEPALKPIEFGERVAELYWIKKNVIVLDPLRCFGAPIIHDHSIPTATLARSAQAEGSTKITANYFDIPERYVREAVKFETRLSA